VILYVSVSHPLAESYNSMNEETVTHSADMTSISFRPVEPRDHDILKSLHNDLFPVKYSDNFFTEAVQGRGIKGGKLFTSIAVLNNNEGEEVVGFIMCQFIASSSCDDAADLFDAGSEPGEVLYILTLGLSRSHRRCGLGSALLQMCVEHANVNRFCGAVYLHVIGYNLPAQRFYEKNGFIFVQEIPDFYRIHGRGYCSHMYALYLNDYCPPLWYRMKAAFREQGEILYRAVCQLGEVAAVGWIFSALVQLVERQQEETEDRPCDPYMDDIELPHDEESLKLNHTLENTLPKEDSRPVDHACTTHNF